MKRTIQGFFVFLALGVSAANTFAGHTITLWPENRKGAVSLAFDDGCMSHVSLGIPALDARGLKGTFFVTVDGVTDGYSPPWNSWRNAAIDGHEIGSHTITHSDLATLPPAQVQDEVAGSKATIDAQVPQQKCLTFSYPFGSFNAAVQAVAGNTYIASRGVQCGLNSAPFDFQNVKACSPDDGDDIYQQSDAAEQQGKWLVAFIHTLDAGRDSCWGSWEIDMWTTYLDYLQRKNLWVGTFGAAVKYIKERSSATLSVLSSSSDQMVLSLTDTLDDAIYNQPLTLRSDVPSGWTSVKVEQGNSSSEIPSTVEGTTRVVYYNAVPDRGLITLRNPQASTPQIASLAPQFTTLGGPAFTLAVSGSNFVSGSKVRWSGSDRVTTFVSGTQLRATILAADVVTAGTVPVTVFNPDGTLSNAATFEVRNPQPTIISLSPSWSTAGGPSFTLTVDGSNFTSGSKVRWKSSDRTTTFVSGSELLAAITAADIASAGTAGVAVYTPAPGGGTSNTDNFDIYPVLSSVTVSPSAVSGGASSAGTVTLSGPAPQGGALVSLSSDNTSAATVPTSVTVGGGASSATFAIATVPVSGATIVRISGLYGALTRFSNLTVNPSSLSSLSLNPSTVQGGNGSTGTVTLSGPAPAGGAVVSLSSGNTSAATVPTSVTVAGGAGSATFAVTTSPVFGSTAVTVSGVYNGVGRTSVLTVAPPPPTLNALAVSPSAVAGGTSSTGTVTLSGPAPGGGAVVSLSSDNTSAATVPASVTVAGGAVSGTFTIATVPVSGATIVRISGLYGSVTRFSDLTVNSPSMSSLSLNPSTVPGGNGSTGTVTLSGPAPAGGAVVSLSSDATSAATVPASVTVAGGASSATFAVTTSLVSGSTAVRISALYGGVTRTAPLTVTPVPVVTVLSPSVATAGDPAFTLTVSGSNFVSGSKVRWNGSDRVTTFGSASQLQVSILTADISTAGTVPVTVLNPDGGLSNAMTFEVLADLSARTDNFNRANESPLKGNWVTWDSGLGTLELYTNQLRSTDRNPYNVWSRRPNESYSSDHYSQIKLTSTPTGEVGGPAVRTQLNGSEINGYIFTVANSTTAAIWVRYGTGGLWQQVGTNFTGTFASGDVYRLAINGNVLTVSKNGVSLGTRTDANNRVPSGGVAGVSVVYPGTWDDWQGGDAIATSLPAITSVTPTFVPIGNPAFTLTVTGSNFVSGSKVRWSGSDRVTTFVSATQLRANILAADVVTAGTVPVTVFNPDGTLSNAAPFEVRSPQPSITDISPTWGTAGGPSFTLIVDGSNFTGSSKVRWKGSDRTTTFVSGTELQASITAADIAGAGTAGVTVYTPAPGGGTSNTLTFDILPVLSSLGVNPSSVVGGSSSTGTVTLTGPAPGGGALVSLSSGNTSAATVPTSVTVGGGASSATFVVSTSPVSGSTAVTVSALYGGVTRTTSLTVLPVNVPSLASLSLNPSTVQGGNGSTGTVTLSGPAPGGGAVVSLSSDNTSAATVPASVTVAGGASSATFAVATVPVSGSTAVTFSALYGGVTRTAPLTVTPVPVGLSSLGVNPSSVVGGSSSTGTVTLSGPAPGGGAVVSLSSDNTSAATVPASVTVAGGASSATFAVTTSPVSGSTAVTISALYGGVTRTAPLTVTPVPAVLSSLGVNPSSVVGGSSSTGTVTLSGPAPGGGAVVSLSSGNTSAATVPTSVTVAGGASSATFVVSTSPVSGSTAVTVSALYGGVTRTTSLTVLPVNVPSLASLSLNPSSVMGGDGSTGTVTLTGPAPGGGAVVSLSSDNTSAATVPASVTVAGGAVSGTFTIATVPVSGATIVRISGLYGSVTRFSDLTVNSPSMSSLSLNPSTVPGGNGSTGTVTLSGPAPAGGAVVSLSSDATSAATVPASVTVAGGASSATFAVTTSLVSGSTAVRISALYGGVTRTAPLTVTPVPAVAVLSPSVATAGDPAFTLTVSGSNFVSGSKVRWNGSDRVTTFGSASQLQVSILTADISTAGTVPVTVLNPDGGLSNAMTFEVLADLSARTDNFNRANESPLKGNWVTWDSGLGTLELYTNQLRSTDRNPYNVWSRRPNESYSSDHYSQIKLTSTPTGEVGGPAVRTQLNGSEINGYIFTVANSTTAAIWVRYGTGGLWQQVGTNFTGTFASGDVYRLAINGNVLTVSKNGVSLGTRTDANNRVPSGGVAGVSVVYPGTWDDWQGGDAIATSLPAITSVTPTFVPIGNPAFTLTVTGSNFVSGSKVRWSGSDRVTTFVSATQLRANILAADVVTAGTVPVTVFNPDGTLSNAAPFEVRSPQPSITDISPTWGTAGGPSFTLIVDGSNFTGSSKVRWKGSDRTTTFVSGTELQASITAADIAGAGTAGVTVYTPAPGGGTSNTLTFDILPVLSSLGVNPSSVVGGSSSTGTVTLTGPAPGGGALVSLSSGNTSAATVPTSVTVAGGAVSATFVVSTSPVSGSTAVTVSALYGGVTRTTSLTVLPVNVPSLASLSLNPSSVVGGSSSTGTVTLTGPAPGGGAVVSLSSDNTSAATVPASVTVAGGASSATFPLTTVAVSNSIAVNVSGVYAGITKTSSLTVNPASITSLSLTPSTIVGGNTSRGTVTLNGPAPGGGAVVSLASNNTTAVTVPASVTVASGNASATFTVTTAVVSNARTVNISSVYGGGTRSATLTVLPENSPPVGHGITLWPENKSGAVSLTFDDGETSQYTLGVPALNARGMKGSFYIITAYAGVPLSAGVWNSWRNVANNGHEIGSHTKTHPDLTQIPPAQLQDEVVGSKVEIDAQITTQKILTFVYPSGIFNSSVMSIVQDNYIAARGVNCNLNGEPFDFYNVSSCTPDDLTLDIYAWTDAAEAQRKWLVVYFHSLLGAMENGWGSYEIGMFTNYLDYLQQKNLWVGTFGATVKYIKERSSATLSVLSSSSDQMVLNLTDSLDDAIYNQPLTLRSEVPSGWTSVKVEQGSSSSEVPSTVEGTTRVVYYNALPDRGLITLKNPQVGPPQITALAPQFAIAGNPAFTLIVSGSNFVSGSKVRWSGSDRVTTFVSATQLRANILAADVVTAGTMPVTVFNPDGTLSNAVPFEARVLSPPSRISALPGERPVALLSH